MNHDELKAMLAEYLGNELDVERRNEFEAALADHPEFSTEVDGLQKTLQTLRALDEPMPTSTVVPRSDRPTKTAGVWRYAAVLAFAFVGGYLARGPAIQIATTPPELVTQLAAADPSAEWRLGLAKLYVEHPSESSLARSLVALSRSARRGD